MFDSQKIARLNVPRWESVYRAELVPGVLSFIAVHDTTRGYALGGCRMVAYDNESQALTDVLRLSRGMTFKNAIADLPLGGGKAVILCDPRLAGDERERVLKEFGRFVAWVNREENAYYTAEDMNTTVEDMHVVARETGNIFGISVDPSPYTAWGVFQAMRHAVDFFAADLFEGRGGLGDKSVLVQGLGKVGSTLVGHLMEAGARVLVSDIREESLSRIKGQFPTVEVVPAEQVFSRDVDLFAPCARGEVVTRANLADLRFKVLCGAANNQLSNTRVGKSLHGRGIVYCPDYVANMGGVCSIQYMEVERLSHEVTLQNIERTVRKMLGLTFRAGLRNNLAFSESVDHVVKKIVWGKPLENLGFNNHTLFPMACTAEPID